MESAFVVSGGFSFLATALLLLGRSSRKISPNPARGRAVSHRPSASPPPGQFITGAFVGERVGPGRMHRLIGGPGQSGSGLPHSKTLVRLRQQPAESARSWNAEGSDSATPLSERKDGPGESQAHPADESGVVAPLCHRTPRRRCDFASNLRSPRGLGVRQSSGAFLGAGGGPGSANRPNDGPRPKR